MGLGSWVDRRVTDCEWELRTSEKGLGSGFGRGARESGRPCTVSGVTSDNGPAVNGPAVTSRNCVLDPRKNETLDVT